MTSPNLGARASVGRNDDPDCAPVPELRPLRITAAVPRKNLLSIVSLRWSGRTLRLLPTMTTFISLASEDQAGVRQFAGEAVDFFAARDIPTVLVRRGPTTGPRSVSSGSIKLETVLQLMPFTCIHAHVQKVEGWRKSNDWLLPLPQDDLVAAWQDLQRSAIETAAFGIACALSMTHADNGDGDALDEA